MQVISRKDAKSKGALRYFTGKPCKHGHVSERYTLKGVCCECHKAAAPSKEYMAEWRDANRETCREYLRDWRRRNPELNRERAAAWGRANKDHKREAMAKWRKENPEASRAIINARRRAMKDQMPPWADASAIREFYKRCPKGYHVDHIIPLKGIMPDGSRVSGLHVLDNLQYLPAFDNQSKNNRVQPHELNALM